MDPALRDQLHGPEPVFEGDELAPGAEEDAHVLNWLSGLSGCKHDSRRHLPKTETSDKQVSRPTGVLTLQSAAGAALPGALAHIWRRFGDAELVTTMAGELVKTKRLAGNVGPEPPCLGVTAPTSQHTLRVDCFNNPEFWLEIDLRTNTARGRVPCSMLFAFKEAHGVSPGAYGKFEVHRVDTESGTLINITHAICRSFWLSLEL